jgi:hypothetical protein
MNAARSVSGLTKGLTVTDIQILQEAFTKSNAAREGNLIVGTCKLTSRGSGPKGSRINLYGLPLCLG